MLSAIADNNTKVIEVNVKSIASNNMVRLDVSKNAGNYVTFYRVKRFFTSSCRCIGNNT